MHIPGLFSSWLVQPCKNNTTSEMKMIPGSSWWWWKADDPLNSRLLPFTELWCSERQVVTKAHHCGSSDKVLPHPHTPSDTALELTVHQTLLYPLLEGAEVKPSAWPSRNWHLMALSLSLPTVSDCDHHETLPSNFSSFSYTQENKPSVLPLPGTALKNRSWMSNQHNMSSQLFNTLDSIFFFGS